MAVITISRQIGSLGTEISREAANRMNYAFFEKSHIGRMLVRYGFPESEVEKFDEKRAPLWDYLSLKRTQFLHLIRAVIFEFASKDNAVIVGRGGQVLLKDFPGTLHVRIIAPFEFRVRRLIESEGVAEKHAAEILRRSDSDSFGYIQSFFHMDWNDPVLYDLLINSAKVSMETAVQLVIDSARGQEVQEGKERAKEKLADLALSQKVEARLMDILGVAFRNLEVHVEKGRVVLKGGVISPAKKEECERATTALEGVERVDNQLWVDQHHRYAP